MESKIRIAIFTAATILVTVCAVFLIAYYNYKTNSQNGSLEPTPTLATQETASLEVTDKSGKSLGKYDLKFQTGATLTEAMQKLSTENSAFHYEAISGQYGNYLNSVNGIAANSTSEFWNIKVNGQDSSLGMDALKLKNGDQIQLVLINF